MCRITTVAANKTNNVRAIVTVSVASTFDVITFNAHLQLISVYVAFLSYSCGSLGVSPILIALSVCRVVYCGQTVQDRHIVCIEVE